MRAELSPEIRSTFNEKTQGIIAALEVTLGCKAQTEHKNNKRYICFFPPAGFGMRKMIAVRVDRITLKWFTEQLLAHDDTFRFKAEEIAKQWLEK